jgi:hypothetical protein
MKTARFPAPRPPERQITFTAVPAVDPPADYPLGAVHLRERFTYPAVSRGQPGEKNVPRCTNPRYEALHELLSARLISRAAAKSYAEPEVNCKKNPGHPNCLD